MRNESLWSLKVPCERCCCNRKAVRTGTVMWPVFSRTDRLCWWDGAGHTKTLLHCGGTRWREASAGVWFVEGIGSVVVRGLWDVSRNAILGVADSRPLRFGIVREDWCQIGRALVLTCRLRGSMAEPAGCTFCPVLSSQACARKPEPLNTNHTGPDVPWPAALLVQALVGASSRMLLRLLTDL